MTSQLTSGSWLPFNDASHTGFRLFCLPHAGAGASLYRLWGSELPDWITVCPVQPPGRETRQSEAPIGEAAPLVTALADEMLPALDGPYAVFGHSTGAICAFELCRLIRERGGPEPVHLLVAGRRAPQIPEEVTGLEDMTPDQLVEVLRRHGGTPEWLMNSPGMLRMIHPLLIADFSVSERYTYTAQPPLDMPVTAFAATADPRASVGQVVAWEKQTRDDFTVHRLHGGHFAVIESASRVHELIVEALQDWEN